MPQNLNWFTLKLNISVLPVLSKILEKHICNNLCKFLRENDLLHGYQSGFRKSFTTETALTRLIEQLLFNLDGNSVTGLVFVDYKKAFDLINHELLIAKLKAIGVSEDYLPLFIDYMSDRKQYVNIDGYHSSTRSINLGVPQGSILGPVLFLVFINDLPASLRKTITDIYADDTTISYATDYKVAPQDVNDGLQSDLDMIKEWSDNNKTILNETKTKTMLICGKRLGKKLSDQQLQVQVNHTELEQVHTHTLLGVKIDDKLSFDEHIEDLCKTLSQRIAVLKKIKSFLPLEQRILYYNVMIKQIMLYGSIVWSSCSIQNLQKAFRLQKRVARVILDANTRANSVELFNKLNWLPFYYEVKVNMCVLIYKCLNGQCPAYMRDIVRVKSDIHTRNNRYSSLNLVCPRYKGETEGGRSFGVRSTRIWNDLPSFLKESPSVHSLKRDLTNIYFASFKAIDTFRVFI